MFVAPERLLSLGAGYRRVVQVQERSLLLMVVRGRTLLLEDRCPHREASLYSATLAGTAAALRTPRCGVRSGQRARAARPLCRPCATAPWPMTPIESVSTCKP
jgi:hypothetical protein